jgi:hypothetical protein
MLLLAAALFTLSGTGEVRGQQASPSNRPTRVPVTVVLLDQLPQADAPFLVQRRPDVSPHDVILLRSNATREQLSDAIRALLVIRQVGGDTATQRATMRMRPDQVRSGPRREFPWVSRVLADLRRAAPQEVAGYGNVRAVEIWLPPQHRRGTR